MKRLFFALIAVTLLIAASPMPVKKTAVVPSDDRELLMEAEIGPQQTEQYRGEGAALNTTAKESDVASYIVALPWFVKAGGALLVLWGFIALFKAVKNGAAGAAAAEIVKFGDESIGKLIRSKREEAAAATGAGRHDAAAAIKNDIAELEALRGKLAERAPAKKAKP